MANHVTWATFDANLDHGTDAMDEYNQKYVRPCVQSLIPQYLSSGAPLPTPDQKLIYGEQHAQDTYQNAHPFKSSGKPVPRPGCDAIHRSLGAITPGADPEWH